MNMQKLLSAGLSEKDINEYRSAFQMFDKTNAGVINGESLKVFYSQFGENFNDEDVKTMVTEFTGDPNATQINFTSFALNFHTKKSTWLGAFGDAFDLIDKDGTGRLEVNRLKEVMALLGEEITDAEAKVMIEKCSTRDSFMSTLSSIATGGSGDVPGNMMPNASSASGFGIPPPMSRGPPPLPGGGGRPPPPLPGMPRGGPGRGALLAGIASARGAPRYVLFMYLTYLKHIHYVYTYYLLVSTLFLCTNIHVYTSNTKYFRPPPPMPMGGGLPPRPPPPLPPT
eukprot:g3282.t1